ncbi:MAG TPA: hypothetical protein VHO26_06265 [Propionibacteriaceae bacterium]|nr:hypothetical protein [Propionibacteriaceae bacterium]
MPTNPTPQAPLTRAQLQKKIDDAVAAATRPLIAQVKAAEALVEKMQKTLNDSRAAEEGRTILKRRPTPAESPRARELRADVRRFENLAKGASNDPTLAAGYRTKAAAAQHELDAITTTTNNRTR